MSSYEQILDTVWDNGRVEINADEDYEGFVAELINEIEFEASEQGVDQDEAVLFALQHVAEVTQETVEEYTELYKEATNEQS